jgi:hypothetical protein
MPGKYKTDNQRYRSPEQITRELRELFQQKPKPKEPAKTYHSNAKWTKIGNSSDSHCLKDTSKENFEYAQAICQLLMERYGSHTRPCETRGHCIETWVTDENGKTVTHF